MSKTAPNPIVSNDLENVLPQFYEPSALAKQLDWPERSVRELARRIGACHIFGKRMLLTRSDIELILEETRQCRSQSTSEEAPGTTVEPLMVGDYADLVKQRAKSPRSASPQKSKQRLGKVVSMAQRKS